MDDEYKTLIAVIGYGLFLLSEVLPLIKGIQANGLAHGVRCALKSECTRPEEQLPVADQVECGAGAFV